MGDDENVMEGCCLKEEELYKEEEQDPCVGDILRLHSGEREGYPLSQRVSVSPPTVSPFTQTLQLHICYFGGITNAFF